jgi:hypothetical protein
MARPIWRDPRYRWLFWGASAEIGQSTPFYSGGRSTLVYLLGVSATRLI